jgi:alanine or glycine:cation symporter, AGCS family
MGENMSEFVGKINDFVSGPILIVFLVGTGLYLTLRLGFIQVRYLMHSFRCVSGKYDDPSEAGDITHFQALCAALSATVGVGNIAGVATAIALGGPGAVFWMWVTAVAGMATKYTSCSLALRYRIIHKDGSASGGPMYFLEQGLNMKWLGNAFAFFAGVAALGIGCAVQSNSVYDGLALVIPESIKAHTIPGGLPLVGGVPYIKLAVGIILSVLVGVVIIGGIKRIAQVASKVVPIMAVFYVGSALIILITHAEHIPAALGEIFKYAFTPLAAGGGFFGVVVARTLQKGVARGVFSNESGIGSAPMAHAAAKTKEMAREGFVAMIGPFIDTLVICTMTALVILITGVWKVNDHQGNMIYGPGAVGLPVEVSIGDVQFKVVGDSTNGLVPIIDPTRTSADGEQSYYRIPTSSSLTATAFERGLGPFGLWVVVIGLILFSYSTMISWSYYGDRCSEYLLGPKSIKPYKWLFCFVIIVGTMSGLELLWKITEVLNSLMAIPNLIALLALSGLVAKETKDYIQRMKDSGDM